MKLNIIYPKHRHFHMNQEINLQTILHFPLVIISILYPSGFNSSNNINVRHLPDLVVDDDGTFKAPTLSSSLVKGARHKLNISTLRWPPLAIRAERAHPTFSLYYRYLKYQPKQLRYINSTRCAKGGKTKRNDTRRSPLRNRSHNRRDHSSLAPMRPGYPNQTGHRSRASSNCYLSN